MYRAWAQRARDAARGGWRSAPDRALPLRRDGRRLRARCRSLRPEAGLHVLEVPDGRGGYERRRVRVTVLADGLERAAARRARAIVRRYRERPTPLVRDAVRGWRTGRLDAVLAGGFDLVE